MLSLFCRPKNRSSRRLFDDPEFERQALTEDNIQLLEPLKPSVTVELRTLKTEQHACIICGSNNMEVLRSPPEGFVGSCYRREGIYVPLGSVMCQKHIADNYIREEDENVLSTKPCLRNAQITDADVLKLLEELASTKLFGISILDFGVDTNVPAEAYEKLIGITRGQFLEMHAFIIPRMRSTRRRSTYNALAIFLMKLRLNLSHRLLAVFFGNRLTKQRISDVIYTVREVLLDTFCKKYIGFDCMTREKYIAEHHTFLSEKLKNCCRATGTPYLLLMGHTYTYKSQETICYNAKHIVCISTGILSNGIIHSYCS